MTKKIQASRLGFMAIGGALALFLMILAGTNTAHAAISNQMGVGSRGNDVTQLQQFLATNPLIYPAGTVSGYYGPLTQAAVVQFQVAYDISQVGRVGPTTMAKINDIMSSGFGLDTSVPYMSNKSVQTSPSTATVNWTTNELARGQVYYDTFPIRSDEANIHFEQPFVSGTSAPNNTDVRNIQSVTIQGLRPNTLYYYLTRAVDNSGNVTMTIPSTFRTD